MDPMGIGIRWIPMDPDRSRCILMGPDGSRWFHRFHGFHKKVSTPQKKVSMPLKMSAHRRIMGRDYLPGLLTIYFDYFEKVSTLDQNYHILKVVSVQTKFVESPAPLTFYCSHLEV